MPSEYKLYMAKLVQKLHTNDYGVPVSYAESKLEKITNSAELIKLLLFSGEAICHLDSGINF